MVMLNHGDGLSKYVPNKSFSTQGFVLSRIVDTLQGVFIKINRSCHDSMIDSNMVS